MRVEDNTYKLIYFDTTNRCNMNCNFCYSHKNKGLPDMDVEWFEEVCKRLPRKVMIRLLGGEPTLHPQLFDIIEIAKKYNHIPTLSSNGIKYKDRDFVKEMVKHKKTFYGMTMNGGIRNNDVYELIEGARVAEDKMEALENIQEFGVQNFGISSIIMRDVNDDFVIGDFFKLYRKYPVITYFKFRTTSPLGKHIKSKPYTTNEYLKLMEKFIPKEDIYAHPCNPMKRKGDECFNCCYNFRYEKNLTVGMVEFNSEPSRKCWRRGQVVPNTFELIPFFQYMNDNYRKD